MLERYTKPPITEAVIDIRLKKHLKPPAVDSLQKALGKHYPKSEPLQHAEINFDMKGAASSRVELQGYRMFSSDGTDIIASQKQGITVSRLAPYDGWDNFIARFIRDWEIWKKKVDPLNDTCRIGVRYINRIDVPLLGKKAIRIEDYFNVSIRTPDPDIMFGEFLARLVTPIEGTPLILILTTSSVPPVILDHCSFLFDIDIFCENQRATRDNVLERLGEMRAQKNRYFEELLTDKAKELFL